MALTQSFCYFIWLFFLFLHLSLIHSLNNNLVESLDSILHDHAFKTLYQQRPHTGALYNGSLPPSLAGMKVSVVRLRSRTVWRLGANFNHFHIPPETLPVPYVKRLLIVYHDLGNRSSYYYNISGYTLLTSVIGFAIYDASSDSRGNESKDLIKLDLNTTGKPIVIAFQNETLHGGTKGRAKCATFGADGRVVLSEMSIPSVCYSTNQGHFSIISPLKKERKILWWFWVIGFVIGVVGLILVGFAVTVLFRARNVKRTHEMEREADEGEVLHTFWIDSSKMPRATVTRTYPVLEGSRLP